MIAGFDGRCGRDGLARFDWEMMERERFMPVPTFSLPLIAFPGPRPSRPRADAPALRPKPRRTGNRRAGHIRQRERRQSRIEPSSTDGLCPNMSLPAGTATPKPTRACSAVKGLLRHILVCYGKLRYSTFPLTAGISAAGRLCRHRS